jgi:hypothetical protein
MWRSAGGGWVLMTTIWKKSINLSNKSTFFLLSQVSCLSWVKRHFGEFSGDLWRDPS